MSIILTVPHAIGIGKDTRAKYVAIKFKKYLEAKGFRIKLFISGVPRDTIDQNRLVARNTPWRKKIIASLTKNDILFDIHSFPNKIESFGTIDNKIPKAVIITAYPKPIPTPNDVKVFSSPTNDIILEVSKTNDAFLLEFNEDHEYLNDLDLYNLFDFIDGQLINKIDTVCNLDNNIESNNLYNNNASNSKNMINIIYVFILIILIMVFYLITINKIIIRLKQIH